MKYPSNPGGLPYYLFPFTRLPLLCLLIANKEGKSKEKCVGIKNTMYYCVCGKGRYTSPIKISIYEEKNSKKVDGKNKIGSYFLFTCFVGQSDPDILSVVKSLFFIALIPVKKGKEIVHIFYTIPRRKKVKKWRWYGKPYISSKFFLGWFILVIWLHWNEWGYFCGR